MIIGHTSVVSMYFFFFQAEDGIRDLTVTGVQTCALPILSDWYSTCAVLIVMPRSFSSGAASISSYFFAVARSEEHTSELQSQSNLVCRLLLEKKKKQK